MAPPLTFEMAQALKARAPLILIAQIEHPSGDGRFWSGAGTLSWNGLIWTGAGTLGTIKPIKHTSAIAIQEIEFSLAGAEPEIVAQLADDVRNRNGAAWLGCLDSRGGVVRDPVQIVDAHLDYQSKKIGDDGTSIITIIARTGFYTLERAADDVWSSEDQRATYANDSGLDMISKLQNQDLIWAPS